MNSFEAQTPRLTPAQVQDMLEINEKANAEWQASNISDADKAIHMKLYRETNMKLYAELYKKGA